MSAPKDRLDLTAILLLTGFCALWGSQQVVIKLSMGDFPPALQAGLRSAGASLLVLIWTRISGIRLFERDGTLWPGLWSGVLFTADFAVLFRALDYASASHTVLFLYTSPFWVAFGAQIWIPGERLRVAQFTGFALAFFGTAVAIADVLQVPQGREVFGDALALLAAILFAATTVLVKASALARIAPAKTLIYQLGVSALVLPLLSLAVGEAWPAQVSAVGLAGLLYQIVIIAFASYLGWFWLIRHYPASRVAAFSFITPIFGALSGGLFLGEPLSPLLGVALALVSAGIYLVNRPQRGH